MQELKTPLLAEEYSATRPEREHKGTQYSVAPEGARAVYVAYNAPPSREMQQELPRRRTDSHVPMRPANVHTRIQPVRLHPSPAKFWLAFMSGLWLICAIAQAYLVFLTHQERGSACVAPDGDKYTVGTDRLYINWAQLITMLLAALLSSPYCGFCYCCREFTSDPPLHVLVHTESGPMVADL
jgi:hypothetical protein